MKRLLSTLQEKWPEYLLEIIVITVGILGAFALNNWNESTGTRKERAEIINNLNREFEVNLESLAEQQVLLQRKSQGCRQILKLIGADKVDKISADTLTISIYESPTWNPATFILEDLRSSGQLKSLENDSLKYLLHQWEEHYENLTEWYGIQLDLLNKTMHLIEKHGAARNLLFVDDLGDSKLSKDNRDLFFLPEFENLVAHQLMVTGMISSIYKNETMVIIEQILRETE